MNWFGRIPILQGGRWEVMYFELVTVTTEWGRDIFGTSTNDTFMFIKKEVD